ncbi:MAG: hypothetical protein IKN45_07335 [Lachnospiraceae bacterium]|nr:hypothetical protein [Lachnospiraceae bacterium]
MNILFIVFMVVGLLLTIGSFFLGKEEEESFPVGIGEEPKTSFTVKTEPKKEASANIEAIEAAKKKAREAVDKDYKFDLHLTDSSNQTVEELERDLLGGLDLSDEPKPAESKPASAPKTTTAPASNKNNGKKSGKKKNAPVNDRYEDLSFTDGAAEEKPASAPASGSNQNNAKPKTQTSKNNSKKGKKK